MEPKDSRLVLKELLDGRPIKVSQCSCAQQTRSCHAQRAPADEGIHLCSAAGSGDIDTIDELLRHEADPNSIDIEVEGVTSNNSAFCKGNSEMVELMLRKGADTEIPDANGRTTKALAVKSRRNKDIYEKNTISRREEHIQIMRTTTVSDGMISDTMTNSCPKRSRQADSCVAKMTKRVTIHLHSQKEAAPRDQNEKLIILPNSLNELFKIGGKFHYYTYFMQNSKIVE